MELELLEGNVEIKILDKTYLVDTTNLDVLKKLMDFRNKYIYGEGFNLSPELIEEMKFIVDSVLGEGVHKQLFPKPSLKEYGLILDFMEIFQEGLTSIANKVFEQKSKQIQETNSEMIETLKNITEIKEVSEKYGIFKKQATKVN